MNTKIEIEIKAFYDYLTDGIENLKAKDWLITAEVCHVNRQFPRESKADIKKLVLKYREAL